MHRRNKRLQLSGTSYARDRLQKRRVQRQLSSKLNGGTRSRRHACGPFIQPEQRAMVSVRPQPVHRSSGIAVVETTAAFRNRPDGLRKQLGLSCRWLYGAVRQQCAGHLPFKRRETANGGFSVLPTGTTAPKRPQKAAQSGPSRVPAGPQMAVERPEYVTEGENGIRICFLPATLALLREVATLCIRRSDPAN